MSKKKAPVRYRDAVNGEFITEKEANKRPREAIKETIKTNKKGK